MLNPICINCGDRFDDVERACPNPSPGKPYVDCGRGGHMFTFEERPMETDRPHRIDSDGVAALWFTRTGAGPDWFNLELHPFAAEEFEGSEIPATLGIRIRLASQLALVTSELADGGFQLARSEVAKLHRQLGAWLATTPENTPAKIAEAQMTSAPQNVPDTVISDEMFAAFAKDAQALLDRGINVSIVPGATDDRRVMLRASRPYNYLTDDEAEILASMLAAMVAPAPSPGKP